MIMTTEKLFVMLKKHNLSDVKEIFVWVVSGDETGDLTMQDGTIYDF